jgi:pheromone shutdown protein TraB
LEQDQNLQRITILGTTHVDKSSVERVRVTISDVRPSVVAVELDEERLIALRDPDRDKLDSPIRSGLLPWLLALLERSVGSLTEVFPGSEMLEAVDEAERVGAKTIMIDRPIQSILKEIGEVPLLEKLRIGLDVVAALFAISTGRTTTHVTKSDFDELIADFEAKYPTLFRILVKERDQYMADRLQEIMESTTGPVIAVVGLGHVKGIKQHLALGRQAPSKADFGLRYEWTLRSFR